MTTVDLDWVAEGLEAAPPLVLLGSLGSTREMWEPQLPELRRHFRVLRPELRGHGASPAPDGPYALDDLVDDLTALLNRVGIARASFAGLSLGGMVALRLAARAPERVDRLALLCTGAWLPNHEAYRERAERVRAEGTGVIAPTVVTRWVTEDSQRHDPALLDRLAAMVAGTDPVGYAGCCDAIGAMDQRDDLAHVTAPTLLVAGGEDAATPPALLEDLRQRLPQAQLVVVPRAAHLANLDQPEVVTRLLVEHFGGSAAKTGQRVRRQVLGDRHVDAAQRAATAFTADWQAFITRTAWGDVWARPGLTRRDRSIATLAVLTALGHDEELGMHVRAALRKGLPAAEVGAVLLHTAISAGVPAANQAFRIAAEVLGGTATGDEA
ncbi:MAG: bifunctional 3-oxoadipate enol-lactonase/4-carboxymuconolactone decarboxylase PcaDC [Actinomycetales bacterium]